MVEECRLFVGGLSQATTTESLFEYFAQLGCSDCKVMWDHNTGKSKGFGFVTFPSREGPQVALAHTHIVDGKQVDVKICMAKGSCPPPRNVAPPTVVAPPGLDNGHADAAAYAAAAVPSVQHVVQTQPSQIAPVSSGGAYVSCGGVSTSYGVGNHHGVSAPPLVPPSGAAPTEHKIFVGGLAQMTTKASLLVYFSQYGACDCIVMMDRDTGRSRGFGFIIFEEAEVVQSVLSVSGHVIDGKAVECRACQDAKTFPDDGAATAQAVEPQPTHHSTRIFVGGLPQTCDDVKLGVHFGQFGPVLDAKVHIDPVTNRSKGFGYINYESPECVEMALANAQSNVIDDKWVEVKRCEVNRTRVQQHWQTQPGGTEAKNSGCDQAAAEWPPPSTTTTLATTESAKSLLAGSLETLSSEQCSQILQVVQLIKNPSTSVLIAELLDQMAPLTRNMNVGQGGKRSGPY